MSHEELQLNLGLRDEKLTSLNFSMSDTSPVDTSIFTINKIKIVTDFEIKIMTHFNFEDLGFTIIGDFERSIDIQVFGSDEAKKHFDIFEFVENEKEELLIPLASKISKIITDITDDAYIFPLLVPPSEWISSEDSEIEILKDDD